MDETMHHITIYNFSFLMSLKLNFFISGAILMTTTAPPFKRIYLYLECMKVAIFGILGIN